MRVNASSRVAIVIPARWYVHEMHEPPALTFRLVRQNAYVFGGSVTRPYTRLRRGTGSAALRPD